GRELTKKLLKTTILSEDLADDLQETLEEEDSKDIDETVFAQIALLLPILYLFNRLPYCVISSPNETINFKYPGMTVICDGTETLTFDHETYEKKPVSFTDFLHDLRNHTPAVSFV